MNRLLLWRRNAQLFCHPHQLGQRSRPHLLHRAPALDFDAKFGSPKFSGNLLIEQTAHSKRQYFAFAWRQRGVPRTLFSNLSLALSICAVALDGLVNRIEQRMKTVWSETQPHRPSSPVTLHCYIDTDRQMFILFVKSILDASSFCQARKRKANISSSSALFVLTRSPTPDSDRMLES